MQLLTSGASPQKIYRQDLQHPPWHGCFQCKSRSTIRQDNFTRDPVLEPLTSGTRRESYEQTAPGFGCSTQSLSIEPIPTVLGTNRTGFVYIVPYDTSHGRYVYAPADQPVFGTKHGKQEQTYPLLSRERFYAPLLMPRQLKVDEYFPI